MDALDALDKTPMMISHLGPWSELAFPVATQRKLTAEGRSPFWLVQDFSLAAQATNEFNLMFPADSYLTVLTAVSDQAAGFAVQLFDPVRRKAFSQKMLNFLDVFGSGQKQLPLQEPLYFKEITPLVLRVVNRAIVTNTGQVALQGCY